MASDEEVSWSLESLSEGRISLSSDDEVAAHPHHRPQINEEDEVTTLQSRLQESIISVVRSEQDENKRRKLKSKVWDEFTKYKGEDGKDWAVCSHCKREFNGSSKKGTTHLKNHLERCQAKRKRAGGDVDKSIKTGDLTGINEKSVIDLIKNSFDAKGMTTLQVDQEEKETGIVLRDQQNERNGKRLKSKVWDEFTKYKGEDGMDWAKCSICEKSFDGSSKKGTTHLKNHLNRCRANFKRKAAGTAGDEDKSVKAMPVVIKEKSVKDSIDEVFETIRFPLLSECVWLGTFDTAAEAAKAAKAYDYTAFRAFRLRGSKAILNFPHEVGGSLDSKLEVDCGKKRKFEETEGFQRNVVVKEEEEETLEPLTPSSWTGMWDDEKVIFSVPPLSPSSPYAGISPLSVY